MIAVLTPTCQRGGLDINWASVCRQTVARDITWLIADTRNRNIEFPDLDLGDEPEVVWLDVPRREGYPKNLMASYNAGLRYAREHDANLFVSLQDYMWIPSYALGRWQEIANNHTGNCLITSLCSITDNPPVEAIADPEGDYTIFAEPYYDKPNETFWWSDLEVRGRNREMNRLYEGHYVEYEFNCAAIGKYIIQSALEFDEEFDKGISLDHQVFARECQRQFGTPIILDTGVHALGLCHKLYFPEVTEANGRLVEINQRYAREKYGL